MVLGHGVDIIEISRIQKAVERWGEHFLAHVLTPSEIEHAKRLRFPYPHIAGRFAAKEAIFKAFDDPHLTWHDVAILNDRTGKPFCRFQKTMEQNVLLSISHSDHYAVASCIISS